MAFSQSILALDIGTKMGWALACPGMPYIYSGTEDFKPSRWEGGGMRFMKFKSWLTDVKQSADKGLDMVVYEEVRRHMSTDAAHAYGGFLGMLTAWCEHHDIAYTSVPVGTIKKHATGRGNANKEAMIDAMKAKGHNPCDDNEADALALMHYALELYGGHDG